jgi:hypothetical protein
VNCQRRVLATLGLDERRARDVTPDLKDYLAAATARHEAGEALADDGETAEPCDVPPPLRSNKAPAGSTPGEGGTRTGEARGEDSEAAP